jgi:hypothetical protein
MDADPGTTALFQAIDIAMGILGCAEAATRASQPAGRSTRASGFQLGEQHRFAAAKCDLIDAKRTCKTRRRCRRSAAYVEEQASKVNVSDGPQRTVATRRRRC